MLSFDAARTLLIAACALALCAPSGAEGKAPPARAETSAAAGSRVLFASPRLASGSARSSSKTGGDAPAAAKSSRATEADARAALVEWGTRLGLEPGAPGLELKYERHGLVRDVFVFERRVDGRVVLGGDVGITLAGGEPIILFAGPVASERIARLRESARREAEAIGGDAAIARVREALAALAAGGRERALRGRSGRSTPVWHAAEDGRLVRAFLVNLPLGEPRGDWRAVVDAGTGALLRLDDQARYARHGSRVDATARVFSPNPVVTLEDPTLRDMEDADQAALAGAYREVTLRDVTLDGGVYRLLGPYVSVVDWDGPPISIPTSAEADFTFTRFDDGFEAAMVYYHLDRAQRYVQELGFTDVVNSAVEADPHGADGADNSYYLPSSKQLSFGDGCVDDAEDADVIYHEYGHAIQDDQVPGWGQTTTARSLGEGFGDYWACSLSAVLGGGFDEAQVFDWDHAGCWAGRRVDGTATMSDFGIDIYQNGAIWSAALWNIREAIGREITDQLVIEAHFGLPPNATYEQNATSLALADAMLYSGVHLSSILYEFDARGIAVDSTGLGPDTIAPSLTLAVLQNPVLTSHVDIMVAASEPLDPSEISGELVQPAPAGTVPLAFSAIDQRQKLYRSEHTLGQSATVSINVSAADFAGNGAEASRSLSALKLGAPGEAQITSPDGRLVARIAPGALPEGTWLLLSQAGPAPAAALAYQVHAGARALLEPIELTLHPAGESLERTTLAVRDESGAGETALASWFDAATGALSAILPGPGTIVARLGAEPTPLLQRGFVRLGNPSPNPSVGSTRIDFEVRAPQRVSLAVYSVAGRRVRDIFEGRVGPGRFDAGWDGNDESGRRVASGVYLFRLQGAQAHATRKVILAR